MLKQITIHTLGLIDHANIEFQSGFTSITGETGSGKTSLVEALKLTLGKKSDFDLIKKGAKKGEVTSVFELESSHLLYPHLKSLGFEIEAGEPVIITRTLFIEGKSKAFINQQPASLHVLQQISKYLCDFIDQNDLVNIHDEYFFHEFIDLTGGLESIKANYAEAFESYQGQKNRLKELRQKCENKQIKESILEEDIKELSSANLTPGEEAEVFEKYKLLQKKKEALSSSDIGSKLLGQDIIPKLKKFKSDKNLSEDEQKLVESAFEALCEACMSFESKLQDQLLDEQAIHTCEERLKTIYVLKRKYNSDLDELPKLLEDKIKELDVLLSLDDAIIEAEDTLEKVFKDLELKASLLSHHRKKHALVLEDQLKNELRPLNMPYAELEFRFNSTTFDKHGHDRIELHIQTNASGVKLPLLQGASGGELARVNFCLFLASSNLQSAPTYIFDEIDAHVGGVTSSLMGDKLQKLADSKQVFCITHFPQMASKGTHHLAFIKKQKDDGTFIEIHSSQNELLNFEIDRMVGMKQ